MPRSDFLAAFYEDCASDLYLPTYSDIQIRNISIYGSFTWPQVVCCHTTQPDSLLTVFVPSGSDSNLSMSMAESQLTSLLMIC